MMKKSLYLIMTLVMLLSIGAVTTSCSVNDIPSGESVDQLPEARITETIRKDDKKATVYNIEYPSVDPFGNPTTLSGSIIIGDEVDADNKKAEGMVLYNHFTVFQKNECPSKGDLAVPLVAVGSKMICVAADYYGFGVTEDKHQAYCISRANAQASVDALLAARKLLKEKGYTWADRLFNLGYSEGGQTSMGVLRLLAEKYPDIKVTHTIAGGGPYDIGETYRQLVSMGESTMPSTVISSALSYSEFFNLDINYEDVFKEDILKKIPECLFSKNYKRTDVEKYLGTNKMVDIFQPIMLDFDSDISKKLMVVFEKDNLCRDWAPRMTERITLVHNELDGCVPYANATKMADYLEQKGFKVFREGIKDEDRYVDGTVFLNAITIEDGELSPTLGAHEAGSMQFAIEFLIVASHYLGLQNWWWYPNPEDLEGF
jgi:hypothetical protein